MRFWFAAMLATFAASSFGSQTDSWAKAGQFPQFRDLSGLPGSGFGVLVDGTPSINGAMALSTPIGFSLGNGIFDIGGASRSFDNQPEFINTKTSNRLSSDGTGQGIVGVHTPLGNFSATFEVISSDFDQVYNGQLQLPLKWDKGGVSIGCQNVTNRHEAAAQDNPGEADLSRSFYAVATYEFADHDYVSLGKGDVRFRGVFGNVSALVCPRVKATTEYDTFGFGQHGVHDLGRLHAGAPRHNRLELRILRLATGSVDSTSREGWCYGLPEDR
jgi:hypothetical protein